MTLNPDTRLLSSKRKTNLDIRQRVIAATRAFFAARDFAETDTPILQISPGNEVHLHAFRTVFRDPHGGAAQPLYLHTSPEFAMKKLLAAGVPRLYQIARCFRNAERSSLHHPEFLMCEWYRVQKTEDSDQGSDKNPLAAIMQDCVELVTAAAEAAGRKMFTARGMSCDPFAAWETISVADAFRRYAAIDLMQNFADAATLKQHAARIGVRVSDGDSWDDLFFRIMGERIEPHLGRERPTFLCDYPAHQAALARKKASDPHLAERFELYICGIELANAFYELTDADEQRARLEADMELKEKIYGERYPIDEDFIAALKFMPSSSGVALGLDRLIMLCAGAENIEDVLWLPVGSQ